ncbi:hypothetical protein KW785_02175 [Candidatus Parcubacteria bacterium]|nr:hypothetical protein [Candidatus Parcubacteria bacterium]
MREESALFSTFHPDKKMELLRYLLSSMTGLLSEYFSNLRDTLAQHDWLIFAFLLAAGLFVGSMVVWIVWTLFSRLERIGMPKHLGHGNVVDKAYEKASTTYITQQVGGGVGIATPITTGPNFYVEIRVPGGKDEYDTVEVGQKFYKRCRNGAQVKVSYRYGRLTGRLHICDIWG